MTTILSRTSKSKIVRDPFPYLVIENALPSKLADELLSAYPTLEYLGSGKQGLMKKGLIPNNEKIRYYSAEVLEDKALASVWRKFVREHVTLEFFKEFLSLFEDDIYDFYPHLRERFEALCLGDVGVRQTDTFSDKKILIDAEMCADTPVKKLSSVKIAHLDNPKKLAVAILYLRRKEDDSQGGSFQIHRLKESSFRIDSSRLIDNESILDLVREVPYKHNTAVVFLNSLHSFHGVSPRAVTKHVRYSFDVALELSDPLFNVAPHTKKTLRERARGYARTILQPFRHSV
jgi:hypothetical protein